MNEQGTQSKNSQPTLLVIRLSALGDVAMTIPAIYSLARQHNKLSVKVLTLQPFARLFIGKPANIELITVSKQNIKGLRGLFTLLKQLSKESITMVADLHNVLRSWVIDLFFKSRGIPVAMLDKGRRDRQLLLKQKSGHQQHQRYTERYFQVFRSLGFALQPAFTHVLANDTANAAVSDKEVHSDFSSMIDEKIVNIGIAPFARYQNKTYPLQQMEQVVRQLSADGRFNILLFSGSKDERTLMEFWQQQYAHCHSVAGHYTLDNEVRLMSHLRLMVSMDSANMHLAALAGTRVLSIWGSTTPQCGFMGWQQQTADAMLLHCDCQPCTIAGSNHCRYHDFHCLADITPDSICQKIISITNPTSHA